eukprot:461448-Amphidinium_carterae.1
MSHLHWHPLHLNGHRQSQKCWKLAVEMDLKRVELMTQNMTFPESAYCLQSKRRYKSQCFKGAYRRASLHKVPIQAKCQFGLASKTRQIDESAYSQGTDFDPKRSDDYDRLETPRPQNN